MAVTLTNDEYNALNKIASATKMDCWFSLGTVNGVDYVYDMEIGVRMSVEKGVRELCEGMVEPVSDPFYRLSRKEVKAFRNLVKRLGIE